MPPEAAEWFSGNTWHEPRWDAAGLAQRKQGQRVAVVLPALNEQDTVGAIVSALHPLTEPAAVDSAVSSSGPLIDELVVMDSGSRDRTPHLAAEAGARVVHREHVLAEYAPRPGKGEVLWRALAATTAELIVFLDSDLVEFDAGFVPALLGPLLMPEPAAEPVQLVKGFYRRPLRTAGAAEHAGGGRVTELTARPLLQALRPELTGMVQPLGGEYAARRELLESVPFAPGYGVEIGLLLDAYHRHGLPSLAQVNLGVRKHRHRNLLELGVMAREILATLLRRCGIADDAGDYVLFDDGPEGWQAHSFGIDVAERPPMREVLASRDGPCAAASSP